MKKSIFATILIACLVILVSGVSYAGHDLPYKVSHDKEYLSKIDKDAADVSLELSKAILEPAPDTYIRTWVPVDYAASKLPNHDFLPTSDLWLINMSIRQC